MKLFKNINFTNVVIITLLILSLLINVYCAYNTYKVERILSIAIGGQPAAKPQKRPSDYKIGMDYEKAVKSEKPMMLLFYADWCHFCIDFMPKYEALYKEYKNKYNFVKINVEDPQHAAEVEKYAITGFPSVFLVNTQKDTHIQLDNSTFGEIKNLEKNLEDFYKENVK